MRANAGKRGFTYTHHVLNKHNEWCISVANQFGFTVNVSTESKSDAVSAFNKGLPTVCVVPSDHPDLLFMMMYSVCHMSSTAA